jgi:hypothetical protein
VSAPRKCIAPIGRRLSRRSRHEFNNVSGLRKTYLQIVEITIMPQSILAIPIFDLGCCLNAAARF